MRLLPGCAHCQRQSKLIHFRSAGQLHGFAAGAAVVLRPGTVGNSDAPGRYEQEVSRPTLAPRAGVLGVRAVLPRQGHALRQRFRPHATSGRDVW